MNIEYRFTHPGAKPPHRAHDTDAGADLHADVAIPVVLKPGERALIPTGVALAIPPGYVGLIHPRSGLAAKHGITVLNTPGTIDADYRGEIKVCLINHGQEPHTVRPSGQPRQVDLNTVVVHFPTPTASDGSGGGQHPSRRVGHSRQLVDYVLEIEAWNGANMPPLFDVGNEP